MGGGGGGSGCVERALWHRHCLRGQKGKECDFIMRVDLGFMVCRQPLRIFEIINELPRCILN